MSFDEILRAVLEFLAILAAVERAWSAAKHGKRADSHRAEADLYSREIHAHGLEHPRSGELLADRLRAGAEAAGIREKTKETHAKTVEAANVDRVNGGQA